MTTERRSATVTRPAVPQPGRAVMRTAGSFVLVAASLILGGGASAQDRTPVASPTGAAPTPLTVGLGYIPNVQFAQFYHAELAGYYDEAGLDVTFQNKIDPELVTLLGAGGDRCRDGRRDEHHPRGKPGHPGRLRDDRLRALSERRVRARGQRHPLRGGPGRQAHRDPGSIRLARGSCSRRCSRRRA